MSCNCSCIDTAYQATVSDLTTGSVVWFNSETSFPLGQYCITYLSGDVQNNFSIYVITSQHENSKTAT